MKKLVSAALALSLTLLAACPAFALPDEVWRQGTAPPQVILPGSAPFGDIGGHWAAEGVTWCYNRGLILGTGPGVFSPDEPMTRGIFLTALARLEGIDPSLYPGSPFPDVSADSPYAPYASWAKARGLIQGREDGAFDAYEPITRQEMAALVDRYLDRQPPPYDGFLGYLDAHTISPWAIESVECVRRMGLMDGYPDGTFDPFATITRAECAVLLQRLATVRYPEV